MGITEASVPLFLVKALFLSYLQQVTELTLPLHVSKVCPRRNSGSRPSAFASITEQNVPLLPGNRAIAPGHTPNGLHIVVSEYIRFYFHTVHGGIPMNYIVQPGDTLYSIANRHGVTVQEIMQANGLTASSPLYVRQTIFIPQPGGPGGPGPQGPGPGLFPPGLFPPGRELEQRVNRLERETDRLQQQLRRTDNEVDRLRQRVDRLEDRVRRLEGR